MRYFLIYISILFISCNEQSVKDKPVQKAAADTVLSASNDNVDTAENYNYQTTPFSLVREYPAIKDSAKFIRSLKENCHIDMSFHEPETINYFKKIKLFGSNKELYLIEYDFHDGSMAEFPWKKQLLFDTVGNLLKIISAMRVNTVNIFSNENPFLFGVFSTGHGNGWHEVYRMRHDTIEQVYDQFLGNRPQTYSTGDNNYITEPNELHHKFQDINNDGYNDIVFYGKVRYSKIDLGYQDTTIPVKYIFLYNKISGHFIEQEDYSKKYAFIYGNTK